MKYMLQIYSAPDSWGHPIFLRAPEATAMSGDERDAMLGRFEALLKEITESGELVTGEALADPVNTRTVRVRDGVPATRRAVRRGQGAARRLLRGRLREHRARPPRSPARFPDAQFAAVEVRPLMDVAGQEM